MPEPDSRRDEARAWRLSDLDVVPLAEAQQRGLDRLDEASLGPATWRARKRSEMRKLFGLERIAPRFTVLAADAATELRVVVSLATPVPCMEPGALDLRVEPGAELALLYPEEILRGPLPGYAIVEVLSPEHVFHANVGRAAGVQRLCLGANVARGFPLVEAVLAAYQAFSMQSVAIDELDPAGVMNPEAARWWQGHTPRIPLSAEPFLPRAGVHRSELRP